jgi:protein TonB
VESEQSLDSAEPKDARFLGERNQYVKEETKAREVDIFRKGGGQRQAGQGGKSLSLKDLAPSKSITPPTPREIEGYREQRQQMAQAERRRGGPQGGENPGSATNDYLKDIKEGDRTMLSTKEFVYFGYYRRIRERLEVAWNSRLRSTLDSYVYGGRRLANQRDYVTGLLIVLDRNGVITGLQVLQQSGATELDQAAIDAFNQAGPFPDPPAGLVDEKGEIKIRWDFVLQS